MYPSMLMQNQIPHRVRHKFYSECGKKLHQGSNSGVIRESYRREITYVIYVARSSGI